MPGVVRKGDVNSAGGKALRGDPSMIVDGKPIVTIGTPVSNHAPKRGKHCNAKTTGGSQNLIINGKPVNLVGDADTCGHKRVQGSPNFIIGR